MGEEIIMTMNKAEESWHGFKVRAEIPLKHIFPNLMDRRAQSPRHLGLRLAPQVTMDLRKVTDGVKIVVLSNDKDAIDRFAFFRDHAAEFESAMQLKIADWGDSGNKQRSFLSPVMRRADLKVVTTLEDAENDWFIQMVLQLEPVIKRLAEEFKLEKTE